LIELANEKLKQFPDMFSRWPNSREMLVKQVGNDTSIFYNYPRLTNAMYNGVKASNVPIEYQNIKEEFDENEHSTITKNKSQFVS
jgi:hypothetical protein